MCAGILKRFETTDIRNVVLVERIGRRSRPILSHAWACRDSVPILVVVVVVVVVVPLPEDALAVVAAALALGA